MMLPSILADKCYSAKVDNQAFASKEQLTPPKMAAAERTMLNQSKVDQQTDDNRLTELVYKRLVELTSSSSSKSNESCSVKNLFNSIKNVGKLNGFVTLTQVLNALKKLEMRGLVYSCEDEFHYLPI